MPTSLYQVKAKLVIAYAASLSPTLSKGAVELMSMLSHVFSKVFYMWQFELQTAQL